MASQYTHLLEPLRAIWLSSLNDIDNAMNLATDGCARCVWCLEVGIEAIVEFIQAIFRHGHSQIIKGGHRNPFVMRHHSGRPTPATYPVIWTILLGHIQTTLQGPTRECVYAFTRRTRQLIQTVRHSIPAAKSLHLLRPLQNHSVCTSVTNPSHLAQLFVPSPHPEPCFE